MSNEMSTAIWGGVVFMDEKEKKNTLGWLL